MYNLASDRNCARLRFDDFAHGTAFERLTNLERRHVRLDVVHAATHVRIHRHETIRDHDLTVFQIADWRFRNFKVFGNGSTIRTRGKIDMA